MLAFIILVIGLVVYCTGRTIEKRRKRRESEERLNEARRREEEAAKKRKEEYRKLLIRRRKSYLEDVIERNERHLRMYGVKWEEEQSAMARYDREHKQEWAEAGLKIPDTKDPYDVPRVIIK